MRQLLEAMQASAGAKCSCEGRSRAHICKARGCCMCARPHDVQQLRHEALQVLDLRAVSRHDIKPDAAEARLSIGAAARPALGRMACNIAGERLLLRQDLAGSRRTIFLYVGALRC